MKLKPTLIACAFALPCLAPLSFYSGNAMAQTQAAGAPYSAPRIDGFDVEPATRLSAGYELLFTLYGSAGGSASVRIDGVIDRFLLEEVEAGVYEGTYTIRNRDRITTLTTVTANLRVGNRIASEILGESLLAGAASPVEIRRASDAAAAATMPRIDRFEVGPVEQLDAGTDLVFSITGSPGAKAAVRIAGVKGKLALDEIARGKYEGIYTIKSRDRVSAASAVTASLRIGERESTAVLGDRLLAAPENMPSARRESAARAAARLCANCGVVESINVVEVNGDGSYLGKIAGGLAGVVIGSQIGSGRGTTAAEIAGAIGGAVAGNEIEKRVRKVRHFDVTTRLSGGGSQTISFASEPAFKVGDKVRVENGTLVPG